MTDRELLELAAKAWGCEHVVDNGRRSLARRDDILAGRWFGWNPLTDDGDALRLAVKLKLKVTIGNGITMVESPRIPDVGVEFYEGAEAATRRAIVRAAAQIAHGVHGSPGSESTRPDQPKLPESGGIGVSSIGLGAEGEQ